MMYTFAVLVVFIADGDSRWSIGIPASAEALSQQRHRPSSPQEDLHVSNWWTRRLLCGGWRGVWPRMVLLPVVGSAGAASRTAEADEEAPPPLPPFPFAGKHWMTLLHTTLHLPSTKGPLFWKALAVRARNAAAAKDAAPRGHFQKRELLRFLALARMVELIVDTVAPPVAASGHKRHV